MYLAIVTPPNDQNHENTVAILGCSLKNAKW